jgi:hypothetical protein
MLTAAASSAVLKQILGCCCKRQHEYCWAQCYLCAVLQDTTNQTPACYDANSVPRLLDRLQITFIPMLVPSTDVTQITIWFPRMAAADYVMHCAIKYMLAMAHKTSQRGMTFEHKAQLCLNILPYLIGSCNLASSIRSSSA